MIPPLSDLITPLTRAQVVATMLTILTTFGFQPTSWAADSVPMAIVNAIAEVYTDASNAVYEIAKGGYLDLASGKWLTLLAWSVFRVERKSATFAETPATLQAVSGAGPEVIAVGQLVIQDANGVRFRNSTGGSLTAGPSSLVLQWKAETPGISGNVAQNTLTQLVTSIAGVSVNNPDPLSVIAVDEQSDASLRAQCRSKWATRAVQAPADAYKTWAIEASTEVTRVAVDDQNPVGPGSVIVYVANDSGPASGGAVSDVDAYIQPRRAISSIIIIQPAVAVDINFNVTVYAKAASAPTAQQVRDAITTYLKDLDIGGEVVPALAPARVFLDEIEAAIQALSPGIVTVTFASPAGDVALADNQVARASPTPTVNVVPV